MFGAEPKGFEIYDFVSKDYYCLLFNPIMENDVREVYCNFKWVQRKVRK